MKQGKLTYIAELCQNHLGKFENIKKMTERCAENGAKVIKLQFIYTKNLTYRPEFENGIKLRIKYFKSKDRLRLNFKD